MRTKRFIVGALGVAAAVATASVATGAPATQTLDAQISSKTTPKYSKKDFKKTSIKVITTVQDAANPTGIPPKATKAVLQFDKKDVKFDTKAAATCDPAQIENTTTAAATAACGDAIVGGGDGMAALPLGAGGTRQDFPVTITAFNRADAKGILLHSRVDALGTTTVLKGVLAGSTLSVDIPPLGGGVGAIPAFTVNVNEGKYVQARCSNKKIDTSATFTYSDAPSVTVTDQQKCKQKKK